VRPAVAAAALALALLALASAAGLRLVSHLRDPHTPEVPQPSQIVARAEPPSVFRLEKLAVRQRGGALVWRGSGEEQEARELSDALEPYVQGSLDEAIRRLKTFTARWPSNGRGYLYLGVAALLSGRPKEAIGPLEAAKTIGSGDPEVAGDAAWYLAFAQQRIGRPDLAAATLEELCAEPTPRGALGCAAQLEVTRSSSTRR
jgi:hypothetical protein